MLDFLLVSTRSTKRDTVEIYPKFIVRESKDLMIRGGDFFAIWDEEHQIWSTNEGVALKLIDNEIDKFAKEYRQNTSSDAVKVMHMWDADSGMVDKWHRYVRMQLWDSFHTLDETLIFANTETKKEDYASKRLPYSLAEGSINAYEELISTLYLPKERHKIEWAIGSIVAGDSKNLQKFLVMYGSAGTGKSTILNIIQQLFQGYYSVFDAKALGMSANAFALEVFRSHPLVAIQHDGDLSRIEDNTRLNSVVSHEQMTVNVKNKSAYPDRFSAFLFMGTNKPVKITDAKSGILRRLIDVSPSGNRLSAQRYNDIIQQIEFELGGIAYHCLEVYKSDPHAYDTYIPMAMMGATNIFYDFVLDSYDVFAADCGITLKAAYDMYKVYCDMAQVAYPASRQAFKEELKNYFNNFHERTMLENGTRVRNYYSGFITDKFEYKPEEQHEPVKDFIKFKEGIQSVLDVECCQCPAQYASGSKPSYIWDSVKTKLCDIDTSQLHYLKLPINHIVLDFDIPDEFGNKSFIKNLEAASKFPATYAELSKSGQGIHLHYYYTGDPEQLKRELAPHVEVKIWVGNSSLRRKLTKCNDLPIATISSGLPLKEETKMVTNTTIENEKHLRHLIAKGLNNEVHDHTTPSIQFIKHILDQAYDSGMQYDVSDMEQYVEDKALNATHQARFCLSLVDEMRFKSDEMPDNVESTNPNAQIIFFDVEVFPNLFIVCLKIPGEEHSVIKLINPTRTEIDEWFFNDAYLPVGFNNRKYDNHIIYGRHIGETNEKLYKRSQALISNQRGATIGAAYNLSYTDIYDFSSVKQSLKKFEIDLDIHHQELGLPWDQPVEEKLWNKVAEYCANDVIATEAVFYDRSQDFVTRQILADIAGMTVNDPTRILTSKIIFGNDKSPQSHFNYRNLALPVRWSDDLPKKYNRDTFYIFDANGDPTYEVYQPGTELPMGYSVLPFFPGYTFEYGKSTYMGEEIGEGGKVYAEWGMYDDVTLLDIASQHPNSLREENLLGDYTPNFTDILDARIFIKHKDFESAGKLLNGVFKPYLTDENQASSLAQALKIVINSVYGYTKASFACPFKDPRNVDNIVAKRGALFMTKLKKHVQDRGFTVAHIKTDSIKIPDATQDIIDFVMNFGKQYGYTFEHEATYDRMCLVNNSVYIAKYTPEYHNGEWTATGAQFQIPYVFKTLFSKEPIDFKDCCVTFSCTTALYLDNNEQLPDVSNAEKELDKLAKKIKKVDEMTEDDRIIISDRMQELKGIIATGHDYHFIGRVGRFCPIKSGCGGYELFREKDGKFYAVAGTTKPDGNKYRWVESELVEKEAWEKIVDLSYFQLLVDEAVDTMNKFGDAEMFISA